MPNHNEPSDTKLEQVELIASGYEWTCPNCDHLNREIEIPKSVICASCNTKFTVWTADHAWE